MPKLPIISGKNLLKILKKYEYVQVRQKGSHVFVEDKNGELSTVIPVHRNEDLGKGLLRSIINDLELDVEDLLNMI
ncbi:MAG: YcfA family protein [Candidatus Peregrinibacteria bacterium GW2011_GWF2_33_10]|nr:MAG: YcfA family protein [Candidatus Peregrinibacteria bacterium GW2011_GWF2_33_10]OGJ44810.1 MAG: hypothetical protein A2263_06255 [Candidatus Peregrinibacteria bacterium RIFOXYA2_FULL_33_21]OGJ47393.1 MAG: hypothetical protein A2272_02655 [Candidatus Peregrinibacteria bacterium RIFOXYA12_FULL_33_12]OGJ50496.1 MAG: hypothetical protein A2307_02880 [Candidatus Peregrinibacteria bacterium RIFOXYB2_FULL_33_20]